MPRVNRTNSKAIVAWPEGERPRERLLRLGAQAVTDAELVAIHLRVGVQGTSAVELARQILKKFGSLHGLAETPFSALLEVKGLPATHHTEEYTPSGGLLENLSNRAFR